MDIFGIIAFGLLVLAGLLYFEQNQKKCVRAIYWFFWDVDHWLKKKFPWYK